MTIDVRIVDGKGTNNTVKVNGEGEIGVVLHPHPPRDEEISAIPFRSFFKNDGSSDMRVDGSTTPVIFSVDADSEDKNDIYISTLSAAIVDAGATLGEFGNLSALTNGLDLVWDTADLGEIVIASGIKTNFEFFRLGLGKPSVNIYSNVSGTAEGILIVINLQETFGLPYGLRLRRGKTDKIYFRVNDDLSTGITQFDIIAYGIKG